MENKNIDFTTEEFAVLLCCFSYCRNSIIKNLDKMVKYDEMKGDSSGDDAEIQSVIKSTAEKLRKLDDNEFIKAAIEALHYGFCE